MMKVNGSPPLTNTGAKNKNSGGLNVSKLACFIDPALQHPTWLGGYLTSIRCHYTAVRCLPMKTRMRADLGTLYYC